MGLGIAGACLAMQLIRRNKKILVLDLPEQNRASAVAAGLFNPVTGIRIVKTWKADELFPYLHQFYSRLEADLGTRFYYPAPLYIPFRSFAEQNEWMSRSQHKNFSEYLLNVETKPMFSDEVKDPLGGILLTRTGYIDTTTFIESIRTYLLDSDSYWHHKIDDERVHTDGPEIKYESITADKIIYCTGIHVKDGKFFDWLPIHALKGEVLTIRTEKPLNRIYNRGVYAVGLATHEYKVGATYQLKDIKEGVTEEGRIELELKLKDLLNVEFTTSHQDWGIRPSTRDRRPFMGEHPTVKNILIFNGLGTKGVSLAPYFSGQLADHLVNGVKLEEEANITRVKSLYSKFK